MSLKCYVASKTLLDLCGIDFPRKNLGYTYEDTEFPEEYIKPTKEAYDEAFTRHLNIALFKELRTNRNTLLEQTDRYATLDYPHSNLAVQQTWFDYRQALRDLPTATEDPANPVWPTAPTS